MSQKYTEEQMDLIIGAAEAASGVDTAVSRLEWASTRIMYGWTDNAKTKARREDLRDGIIRLMLQADELSAKLRQLERDAREGKA